MKIGYLRVSTEEQRPDRQIDALEPLCDELHIETISATAQTRPVFQAVLDKLKSGDSLVVWDLDRAFRSTVDAITCVEALRFRGVEFQIVTLGVDTETADGKLIYTMIAALAEHERNRLSERTKQGLAAARKRGKVLGRPKKLTPKQVSHARAKYITKEATLTELAAALSVDVSTISRAIKKTKQQ